MQYLSDSFDRLSFFCSVPPSAPTQQMKGPNNHSTTIAFVEEGSVLALASQEPSSLESSNDEFSSSIANSSFTGEESAHGFCNTGSLDLEQGSRIVFPTYPFDMNCSFPDDFTSGLGSVDEFSDHCINDTLSDLTTSSDLVDYSSDFSLPLEFGTEFSGVVSPSSRCVGALKDLPLEYSQCDCIEPNGYSCTNNSSGSYGAEDSRGSKGSDDSSDQRDSDEYHDPMRSDVLISNSNQHTLSTSLLLDQRDICVTMGIEGYVNPVPYCFPSGADILTDQAEEVCQEPDGYRTSFNASASALPSLDNCFLPCTFSTGETLCTTSDNCNSFGIVRFFESV